MATSLHSGHQRCFGSVSVLLVAFLIAGCGDSGSSGNARSTVSGGNDKAAITGEFAFWPQFPDDPRVQFVQSIKSNEDVSQRQASSFEKLVFGREAEANDLINKPYGVAMKNGVIYTCDIRNDCVVAMDLKKRQSRILGQSGSMVLKQPTAVAVDDAGEIFVADADLGTIVVFDATERFSRVMGVPKFKPAGIAVYGDRVYATNLTQQNVQVFDKRTGSPISTIGTTGDADGQFRLPLGIAADSKGNIWVADMMRCRMQKFSPEGKFLVGFGELGDYRGSFARPKHIAVDTDDILYVVDAAFQNVQMFDGQNRALMHFGANGPFPGAMNLPAGICVSEDSLPVVAERIHPGFKAKRVIVVTNQFGGEKVSLYAIGELKEGYSAREVSAAGVRVPTGMDSAPSKERLKLQMPGDKEPLPEKPVAAPAPPDKK